MYVIPKSPQRVAQNAILLFLPVKSNFCRKKSATVVFVTDDGGLDFDDIVDDV